MKKFAILALAAVLVVALTVPAAALENEFGGYWRTRFTNEGHFNGEKDDLGSYRFVDTRTRLYYTAKINDNLKLVNKFEMDATWGSSSGSRNGRSTATIPAYTFVDGAGQTNTIPATTIVTSGNNKGYGETEADGVNIEIKNTYADFNTGPVNWTVGTQPFNLFRSFYIDGGNDCTGLIARWKVLDNLVLAGSWLKAYEGGADGGNNSDVDSYTIGGAIYLSENISIKPAISWAHSSEVDAAYGAVLLANGNAINTFDTVTSSAPLGELNLLTYGLDFDMDFDNFGLWLTAFMQDGTLDATGKDLDIRAWLAAVGGNVMLGPVDLHGQFFYTPGDDDTDQINPLGRDSKIKNVQAPLASYYWAEILGYGVFDQAAPDGSPADKIYNIWAANIGASFKPMDKLKIGADLWYAKRQNDVLYVDPLSPTGFRAESKLGTELDVRVTYQLVEGLNLDLVGAYLWAGDAVSVDGNNNENPYELGAQLSLSF
jgi:hypothetical protein